VPNQQQKDSFTATTSRGHYASNKRSRESCKCDKAEHHLSLTVTPAVVGWRV